jgi:peptidoglycan glycosyltransferase
VFRRGKVEIQAPHFVFWVISLLEENYDPELLRKGGLTIKTTLDYDIQQLAEQSIAENETSSLDAYGADNAALVYVNSHDGDILAYV